ncbi:anthranilate synthase component II domain protein [Mycobacterium xenopi 4042]|uniref:Anthranilate synthase component II domain protein n=1 Tax=Mycobacterium xenopi 4042 TaxID=1299334 RepID=X8CJX0_MYCXE|nr:anthranilate synthase component II domain protein [Mycobacterium xenopi 4042]
MVRILVVDNYDSFVFNLVQYLASSASKPKCGATTTPG